MRRVLAALALLLAPSLAWAQAGPPIQGFGVPPLASIPGTTPVTDGHLTMTTGKVLCRTTAGTGAVGVGLGASATGAAGAGVVAAVAPVTWARVRLIAAVVARPVPALFRGVTLKM